MWIQMSPPAASPGALGAGLSLVHEHSSVCNKRGGREGRTHPLSVSIPTHLPRSLLLPLAARRASFASVAPKLHPAMQVRVAGHCISVVYGSKVHSAEMMDLRCLLPAWLLTHLTGPPILCICCRRIPALAGPDNRHLPGVQLRLHLLCRRRLLHNTLRGHHLQQWCERGAPGRLCNPAHSCAAKLQLSLRTHPFPPAAGQEYDPEKETCAQCPAGMKRSVSTEDSCVPW